MKLLSDKKDLEKLYGKISIGFLLVQDIFVIILLMVISSFSGNLGIDGLSFGKILSGILLIIGFILISVYVYGIGKEQTMDMMKSIRQSILVNKKSFFMFVMLLLLVLVQ